MIHRVSLFLLFAVGLNLSAAEDSGSGLVLHLDADGARDARLVRVVALHVPRGESASPFLAPGAFKAKWEGTLLLEKRSRLVFTLEGTGAARLLIDGEMLVGEMGASSESARLSSGEHTLVCEYESPAEGDAQIRLFWEERDFPREPVPMEAFLHDPADVSLARAQTLRLGRNLVAERRCDACHDPKVDAKMPELKLAAPSLEGVGERLRQDWLARWIADPKAERSSAHMPVLFKEDAGRKATDIAAYLAAGAPTMEVAPQPTAGEITNGGQLFHQQGCISCHVLTATDDGDRISLLHVGGKFRVGALAAFLREPTKFHEASRMPGFQFTDEEANAVEGFLRSRSNDPGAVVPAGDVGQGRELFVRSGCLNCHARGDEKSTMAPARALAELKSADCSGARFDLADPEKSALGVFLNEKQASLSLGRSVPAEFAQRQFEELRCHACHSRDGSPPLREKFASEVLSLAPPESGGGEGKPALKASAPPLDHLGMKLRSEWRALLFAGEIEPKVRPWLAARMPAFPTRADHLAIGFNHAVGLPAATPEMPAIDPEMVKVGEAMTGSTGLACATCHAIGDQKAIAVFEAEGPNLKGAARLNPDYFRLWMNDPARVWPGTIMPKYAVDGKTPLTQHFDGDAARQFDAIYEYLRSLSDK